ncbi:MAG: PTS sugar transporter subunit IIB [Erysipelotrichaceae bacterium]|nr:PTS sugar transporter subunit IIB [Erysipelotrichaceae bacterium]MBQ1482911.1 PTS sugar transporter subunit IIB [Erysipelotrichaceae bacterium]
MATLKVMLCCGAGMSSGFLASNARKYAKKNKLDVSVEARSHAEVNEYMNSIDVLLLGPHYAGELENFRNKAAAYNVVVDIIPEKMYASLDGAGIIDLANSLVKDR